MKKKSKTSRSVVTSSRSRVRRTVLQQMSKAGMRTPKEEILERIVTAVVDDHLSTKAVAQTMRTLWIWIGVPRNQTYDQWAEDLYRVLEKGEK